MANRTRPNQILFFVSDDEKRIIKAKMAQLGTKNMGAYLRKMAIDGYIIKVDYTQQKKLAAAVSRVASNINQICRRINSTGHFYADDIAELKERQGEIGLVRVENGELDAQLLFAEGLEPVINEVPVFRDFAACVFVEHDLTENRLVKRLIVLCSQQERRYAVFASAA